MRVRISEIAIGQRKRRLDEATVDRLMDSIRIHGLLHPITVTKKKTGYRLVAGWHRLEACRRLDHQEMAVVMVDGPELQLELAEIDENLIRAELSPIQRADCHARREDILKTLGLVTGHGGDRSSRQVGDLKSSYADQIAEALGVSARSVQRDLHRAKSVGPEIRGVLNKAMDNLTGAQLDSIAKANPEQQRRAAEEANRAGGSELDRQAAIMKGVREAEERSAAPRESRFNKSERLEIRRSENLDAAKRAYLWLDEEDRQEFRNWTAEVDPARGKIIDIDAAT